MKRRIGICMTVLTAAVMALVIVNSYRGEPAKEEVAYGTETETEQEPEAFVPVSAARVSYAYMLREHNGRVAVYRQGSDEVYMETSILVESLPAEVYEELKDGIGFVDEAGLFDFLESYSS